MFSYYILTANACTRSLFAIFDLLVGVKYRIRQICPIPPLPGRPLLFIWTLGCVRCGVIGLLLVVEKLLIVGLASFDQSGTDSCLLEAGYTGGPRPLIY